MKSVFSRKQITFFFVFSIFLATIGCGGGGGGGGESVLNNPVGTGTGTGVITETSTTTSTNTATNTGTSSSTLLSSTGYSSVAFPATTSNITVSSPPSGKVALVLANTSNKTVTVSLSATIAGFAASIKPTISQSQLRPNLHNSVKVDKEAEFHAYLRRLEKTMPPISPSNRALANKAVSSIKADFLGQVTTFDIIYGTSGQKKTVTATCRKISAISGTNTKINFYFDNAATYDSTAEALITALSSAWNTIYPVVRATFGSEPPADFNSLGPDITVLISPSVETAGFFYSGDLYPPSQVQGGVSNQRKMFYLQYNNDYTTDTLASTMAHEFQHMINFYQRKLNNLEEEDWLNECLSGYAEHVSGYSIATNNQSKALQVNKFFAAIDSHPLVATPWPGTHENYGQVYLFGTWLGQHYGNNGSLISLLQSRKVGIAAVEELTGESFDSLFGKWMVALYVNDKTGNSIYGYKDLDLRGTYSYGGKPVSVTLTGPKLKTNDGLYPYNSGYFSIAHHASAFIEFTGVGNSTLSIVLPAGVKAYELHK